MVKKQRKSGKLTDHIEIITTEDTSDSVHSGPEDFVKPLVDEIVATRLPDIDLTSKEGAARAMEMLGGKLSELNQYQDRVKKLKALLLQKKFELNNE